MPFLVETKGNVFVDVALVAQRVFILTVHFQTSNQETEPIVKSGVIGQYFTDMRCIYTDTALT